MGFVYGIVTLITNIVMSKIDLHTHSYFSDGEWSPERILNEAISNDVSVLSVTDHNVLTRSENIQDIAKNANILLVDGTEISTLYRNPLGDFSLHVLGYSKNFNQSHLENGLEKTISAYNERARKIIDKLNDKFPNLNLDFDTIYSAGHEAYVSRNTLAHLLVAKMPELSVRDALKQHVFVEETDAWMIHTEDSFRLISEAGGIPVLAHSGRELRKIGHEAYEAMIEHFSEQGLFGIEVYYPKHTVEEIEYIKSIAHKFNLCITGGSDFHGPVYTPNINIGTEIPTDSISHFLALVGQ